MALVLITSVIKTSNNSLSYTNTRSVYNYTERYAQTLKTIESVRNKIPNCKIFFIECSKFTGEDIYMENTFKELVDIYINVYDEDDYKNLTSSLSKSMGEGMMTIYALNYIINNNIETSCLIKISGRYYLSDSFNYEIFKQNKSVIKQIHGNKDNIFTALYKLTSVEIPRFAEHLYNSINDMSNCIGYELIFAKFVAKIHRDDLAVVEKIGLQGYVSVSGEFYDG